MSANEEVDYEEEVGMTVEAPAPENEAEGEQAARGRGAHGKGGKQYKGGNKGEFKTKGRGFDRRGDDENDRYDGRGGVFERLEQSNKSGPQQCKFFLQTLIAICSNLHLFPNEISY